VNRTMRRRAAIGAAGLAALAAAGGAYAATTGSGTSERQALVNDAARRLHVTPQQLRSALQGALSDRLDAAVAAGRLTRAQADAIKRRANQHGGLPLLGGGRLGHRHGLFGGLDAAASYLGLTRAQLGQQLRSGKSLAAVARAGSWSPASSRRSSPLRASAWTPRWPPSGSPRPRSSGS
jgi:hypothetical protein